MFRMAACRYAAMLIVEPMLREYTVDTIYQTTDLDTIYSLLAKRCERDPDDLIAQWQDDETRQWHDVSAGQMNDRVREVAKGLLGLGVKPGSMVVIYAATCYEWGVVDFACASIGAVSVPVYETDSPKQTGDIVAEVEPVIAFAGDDSHAQILEQIRAHSESLRYVFNFKANGLDAVADFGESVSDEELDKAIGRVRADDLFTIVYTSGSTGKPKGVMLSHRNFNHTVYNGYEVLNDMLYQPSRLLLFLPLAHCFARYIQYVAIGSHGVVGYISSAKRLLADLRGFKPTYLLGVPRVFEKVYNAASQKAGAGMKGRIFAKAAATAREWSHAQQEGNGFSASLRMRHAMYDRLIYRTIMGVFGGHCEYAVSGGAPLDGAIAHFFNGVGLPLLEGYGMTETCAPAMVNPTKGYRIGTVGLPLQGVSVGLGEDGELCIKSRAVCVGYHNHPEITQSQIVDGWLHTGDLGDIDDDGFVTITGRKKDLIITAGGKNVSPGILEASVMTSPVVDQCVVIGDRKPFIAAIVSLDLDETNAWLAAQGVEQVSDLAEAVRNPIVYAEVERAVNAANDLVSRAESIRKFEIVPEPFTEENGLLTASMKARRQAVIDHFGELIDTRIYAPKGR
mgnify:CR=1 FL=1